MSKTEIYRKKQPLERVYNFESFKESFDNYQDNLDKIDINVLIPAQEIQEIKVFGEELQYRWCILRVLHDFGIDCWDEYFDFPDKDIEKAIAKIKIPESLKSCEELTNIDFDVLKKVRTFDLMLDYSKLLAIYKNCVNIISLTIKAVNTHGIKIDISNNEDTFLDLFSINAYIKREYEWFDKAKSFDPEIISKNSNVEIDDEELEKKDGFYNVDEIL